MSRTDRAIEVALCILVALLIATLLWVESRPAGLCHWKGVMTNSTNSRNSTNPRNSMNSGTRFLKGARLHTLAQGFFGWFNPNNFMDVYQEWHAFVEGWCEVLCPWPARHQLTGELLTDLQGDHHYYAFGRVTGVITWLVIATIVKAVFF